jgi:1-aminocyclopropane-1-carboxylate synthase
MRRALANQYCESDNPNGIISLGIAENTLMANELSEFLSKNMKITPQLFSYGGACPGLPSITTGLLKLYNSEPFCPLLPVKKQHLYVTAGCAALLDQLFWVLCNEGEGVLLGKPTYGGFAADMTARAKLRPIAVSLKGMDPFSVEAVDRYEEELLRSEQNGVKVRMLVLNTPHNPLGQYLRISFLAYLDVTLQRRWSPLCVFAKNIKFTSCQMRSTPCQRSVQMTFLIQHPLPHC